MPLSGIISTARVPTAVDEISELTAAPKSPMVAQNVFDRLSARPISPLDVKRRKLKGKR